MSNMDIANIGDNVVDAVIANAEWIISVWVQEQIAEVRGKLEDLLNDLEVIQGTIEQYPWYFEEWEKEDTERRISEVINTISKI